MQVRLESRSPSSVVTVVKDDKWVVVVYTQYKKKFMQGPNDSIILTDTVIWAPAAASATISVVIRRVEVAWDTGTSGDGGGGCGGG